MAATDKPNVPAKPNYCFACGPDNPDGLHLQFQYDSERKSVECRLQLPSRYQGATGFAHGGLIATLLDEAMAKVNGLGGIRAVTIRLDVSYLRMVPVEKELLLTGKRVHKKGRKLYLYAELVGKDQEILATARGTFWDVNPKIR